MMGSPEARRARRPDYSWRLKAQMAAPRAIALMAATTSTSWAMVKVWSPTVTPRPRALASEPRKTWRTASTP